MSQGELVERIWAHDATVWTGADEAQWLGWLDEPRRMREDVDLLLQFADSVVDRFDAVRVTVAVFDGDLRFSVRAQIG